MRNRHRQDTCSTGKDRAGICTIMELDKGFFRIERYRAIDGPEEEDRKRSWRKGIRGRFDVNVSVESPSAKKIPFLERGGNFPSLRLRHPPPSSSKMLGVKLIIHYGFPSLRRLSLTRFGHKFSCARSKKRGEKNINAAVPGIRQLTFSEEKRHTNWQFEHFTQGLMQRSRSL